MTPRAPFLPKKRNIISKHTGTSRLSPSHLVELTLSFLMVPPWPLRSSSSPRTVNFPLADTIAPTAPLFARPLPNIHTSSDTASTPPKRYHYLIWVSNHPPVPSCGDPPAGLLHSGAFIYAIADAPFRVDQIAALTPLLPLISSYPPAIIHSFTS